MRLIQACPGWRGVQSQVRDDGSFPNIIKDRRLTPRKMLQSDCFDSPGVSAFLVLTVTGLDQDLEVSFSHATLLGAEGEQLQHVWLNSSSSSSHSVEELVGWVDSVPRVPFCVRLTGHDSRGNKLERVSTETVQPTHVQIQV